MPVYVKDSKAVLHVHVPKTGGTSLARFFRGNGFQVHYVDGGGPKSLLRYLRCPPQHMHAELLNIVFRTGRFDYVFMTVREPMARVISEYKMRTRAKQTEMGLAAWLDHSFKRYRDDPYAIENHIRPQAEFYLPGASVFRQEDGFGESFVAGVEQALGAPLAERVVEPAHVAPEASTPIDPAEIEAVRPLVRQFYRVDYLTFGYPP